jgi:hypothetical protein
VTIEAARGSRSDLAPYSELTDTHGVDVYPVTIDRDSPVGLDVAPDLHQVGIWTRRLAQITPDHSVWTTLQICVSSSYDRGSGHYVLPNSLQERYMVYDAIINGARGIAFFGGNNSHCWDRTDRAHDWNWTYWDSTLRPLIAELGPRSPMAPALVNPRSTGALVTSNPTTQAISRIATSSGGSKELWVIAARHGSGTKTVTITGLPTTGHATVYTEGRKVKVENGSITDRFEQWQVHVYDIHVQGQSRPARTLRLAPVGRYALGHKTRRHTGVAGLGVCPYSLWRRIHNGSEALSSRPFGVRSSRP